MKNKFRSFFKASMLTLLALNIVACNPEEEVLLANLDVQVEVAASFTDLSTDGLYVYITNTIDNGVDSAMTDASGLAVFTDMAPGTYNVSVSMELSAEEAGAASGYYEEMTLNAVENSLELVGGIDSDLTVELDGQPSSSLVIKEFYYNGAADFTVMMKDQFVEIYNNSAEVVHADGLYIASLAPNTAGTSVDEVPLDLDMTEFVYAQKILKVPGNGTEYPIQPGESIILCLNAVDYTAGGTIAGTVDLSGADFETYAVDWLTSLGRTGNAYFDIDNAEVPNLECVYLNIENYGWFNFDLPSASIAIFSNDNYTVETIVNPAADTPPEFYHYYAKISVEDIIDGIDMMANAETGAFKRLPTSVDAGFNFIESTYTGKSVKRKVAKDADGRKILQDTNNSTNDFEVLDVPTPGTL